MFAGNAIKVAMEKDYQNYYQNRHDLKLTENYKDLKIGAHSCIETISLTN